jgi:hypothetical protein
MRKLLVLLGIVVTVLNAATLPFTTEFNDYGGFITAHGMWRVEAPTKESETILADTRIDVTRLVGRN